MGEVREKIEWAEKLSLGISVVVAILLGVGMGIWLKNLFGQWWWILVGSFWGIAAAYQNLKRAYLKVKKELEEEGEKYREYQFNRGNPTGEKGNYSLPKNSPRFDEEDDLSQFEK
ncbi:MAG: AtpZ/AtpI family protein [Campylobacterales bacterium]